MGPYTVFKTPPSTPKPAEPPVFDSPKKVVSPPPVQPPPQQIDKSVSTWHLSDGSVSGFFRNAVNKVQNAHSSLDEHLARWFGLNQSKYQWALDDYYENKELTNIWNIKSTSGLLKGTVVWVSRDRLACNLLLLIAAVKQVWRGVLGSKLPHQRLTPLIKSPKRDWLSPPSHAGSKDDHNDLAGNLELIKTKRVRTNWQKLAIVTLAAGVLALGTNIYVNPPLAPPLVGGYGYGFGVPFYGGWGWSPFSFFAPGPSVAIVGGGFETLALFMFLGAVAAVIKRFLGSRDEDDY
ncbi:hypothetical protein GH714_003832 [Hevea brasiliensis]|uniref:Uncharacterized protein n=1 Tax=Hevea brasiliensis TaxID=3981 RepID=A0A6A6M8G8_HEVBR|nr:hypothetical protein GH714_003832 [Hevea brasiliensis]